MIINYDCPEKYWHKPIWQGGMGVYISTPELAKSVAINGGIGTVSSALADQVLVRILQNGDPDGHYRKALQSFPFQEIVIPIMEKYFVLNGNPEKFKFAKPLTLTPDRESIALVVLANYCMVKIAKEGHINPIAINILEKVQLPIVYAILGAMLAKVDVIVVGAGIPLQIPDVIEAISKGEIASYSVDVEGSKEKGKVEFDIKKFFGINSITIRKPAFVPIVSTHSLASILNNKLPGKIDGFIIENWTAGGHNAPPRGKGINEKGEPLYTEKDTPDLEVFRQIGLPFWLAGGYASKEAFQFAKKEGAIGVSLGSIFALFKGSGMRDDIRKEAIRKIRKGEIFPFTDAKASPTGFPFKVVNVFNTFGAIELIFKRKPKCDMGALIHPYLNENGKVAYRCPAEPVSNFINKGGFRDLTIGVVCLCNGLMNNTKLVGSNSPAVVTLGLNTHFLYDFELIKNDECLDYTVEDIFRYILG